MIAIPILPNKIQDPDVERIVYLFLGFLISLLVGCWDRRRLSVCIKVSHPCCLIQRFFFSFWDFPRFCFQ